MMTYSIEEASKEKKSKTEKQENENKMDEIALEGLNVRGAIPRKFKMYIIEICYICSCILILYVLLLLGYVGIRFTEDKTYKTSLKNVWIAFSAVTGKFGEMKFMF